MAITIDKILLSAYVEARSDIDTDHIEGIKCLGRTRKLLVAFRKEEREKAIEEAIEFEHQYIAFITKCNHESISNEEVGKRLREYLTKKANE